MLRFGSQTNFQLLEAKWYIPSEKVGQNIDPLRNSFFVTKYQHWTGTSVLEPFLGPRDPWGGVWGAMGGFGVSANPKIAIFSQRPILTLKCNEMDHNNLSHYVFEFLGQNWSPGVKKWPFWAKIGYTKKLIFLKNTSSNFVHIAHKDTFWVNNNDEKMIGAALRQIFFQYGHFSKFWPGHFLTGRN